MPNGTASCGLYASVGNNYFFKRDLPEFTEDQFESISEGEASAMGANLQVVGT